ncbi:PREDICTED: GLABROUS1 enhancer-binding protein-like [Camelina sativa]|uniref:GLABROUS1 enhancer-binding protein-like n=1 Tax=Camelina sativa TaxID=90675 RepID=A0ABM0UBZ2_CAMSA|nr:PREDICTED: GLABROUS1 enhancer-binding protein-like [Camelina sativa]
MAPKKAELIDNPPVVSSSEEEESGSSGDESDSSAEVSRKDVSSSKKPESDSEGESESESDSEPEPAKKPVVATKAKSDAASGSAAALPESSKSKRPLKEAEPEANKKLKISETEHVVKTAKANDNESSKKISKEDAKKMFQRLFSETDEVALLQGVLDFTSTKGDPYEDSDAFCSYVKKLIDFDATKSQIVTKLQRLKKKFGNTVKNAAKKGKSEDEVKFAKDIERKAFELARKIWGSNGVMTSKSRKKIGGTTPVAATKDMKLVAHSTPKKPQEGNRPEKTEGKGGLSIGREIALFFNAENSGSCCLDESTITAVWKKVADGAKKTQVEEKWKKLKAKQVELCLQRTELTNETAKMILEAYES